MSGRFPNAPDLTLQLAHGVMDDAGHFDLLAHGVFFFTLGFLGSLAGPAEA